MDPSMLQNGPPRLSPFHFDTDPDPDPAFHFNAGPDPAFHSDADPDPASQNDADPSGYGSASNTASNPFQNNTGTVVRKEDSRYF